MKLYSGYLIGGVPFWQIENSGMTEEEAETFKEEVAIIDREGKSKVADMAEANLSGNGLLDKEKWNRTNQDN
jgi:hypothetical protein